MFCAARIIASLTSAPPALKGVGNDFEKASLASGVVAEGVALLGHSGP